ncbi:hypothetical protein TRFO_12809 [Tritrichomonas foetus]|uniref:Uncharacterized protein n=1 Tax=Tritrichomonas foetus TaxID=1144522 RepID=A0A1J4L1I6_9EUKA|nr:hypothetical protein TRFO_12809 [Tritrichomonas foetus]|eukprot:OHT16928.1 hypothetical protein TRFO_12809 [Tritrichomonas foetus]
MNDMANQLFMPIDEDDEGENGGFREEDENAANLGIGENLDQIPISLSKGGKLSLQDLAVSNSGQFRQMNSASGNSAKNSSKNINFENQGENNGENQGEIQHQNFNNSINSNSQSTPEKESNPLSGTGASDIISCSISEAQSEAPTSLNNSIKSGNQPLNNSINNSSNTLMSNNSAEENPNDAPISLFDIRGDEHGMVPQIQEMAKALSIHQKQLEQPYPTKQQQKNANFNNNNNNTQNPQKSGSNNLHPSNPNSGRNNSASKPNSDIRNGSARSTGSRHSAASTTKKTIISPRSPSGRRSEQAAASPHSAQRSDRSRKSSNSTNSNHSNTQNNSNNTSNNNSVNNSPRMRPPTALAGLIDEKSSALMGNSPQGQPPNENENPPHQAGEQAAPKEIDQETAQPTSAKVETHQTEPEQQIDTETVSPQENQNKQNEAPLENIIQQKLSEILTNDQTIPEEEPPKLKETSKPEEQQPNTETQNLEQNQSENQNHTDGPNPDQQSPQTKTDVQNPKEDTASENVETQPPNPPENETQTQQGEIEEGLHVADQEIVPIIPMLPKKPVYEEEELEQKLRDFIRTKGKTFPKIPPDMRSPLFQHISRKRVQAIENQSYDEGEKLMDAQELLRKLMKKDMIENDVTYEKNATKQRLEDVKEELKNENYRWDVQMKELTDILKQQEEKLLEKQQKEVDDFVDFWSRPELFHEFNKASPLLLQYREVEKMMALQGDFRGAKQMKKRAEEQEKLETLAAQERARKGMQTNYEELRRKHINQLEGHRRNAHKLTMQYEVRREQDIQPLRMAVKKLEALKDQKPLPRRSPPVSKSQLVKKRNRDLVIGDDRPPITTPRTLEKLARIRISPRSDQLPLRPVETRGFLKKQMKSQKGPKKEEKSGTKKSF